MSRRQSSTGQGETREGEGFDLDAQQRSSGGNDLDAGCGSLGRGERNRGGLDDSEMDFDLAVRLAEQESEGLLEPTADASDEGRAPTTSSPLPKARVRLEEAGALVASTRRRASLSRRGGRPRGARDATRAFLIRRANLDDNQLSGLANVRPEIIHELALREQRYQASFGTSGTVFRVNGSTSGASASASGSGSGRGRGNRGRRHSR